MAIIDATNTVFGRLASIVAERALKGEKMDIVNVDKCIIIGHRTVILGKYKSRLGMRGKANPEKGPKYSRAPEKIMKRAIRGMLPMDKERGRTALKKIRVHIGLPAIFKGKELEKLSIAQYNGKEDAMKLRDVSTSLGWK